MWSRQRRKLQNDERQTGSAPRANGHATRKMTTVPLDENLDEDLDLL